MIILVCAASVVFILGSIVQWVSNHGGQAPAVVRKALRKPPAEDSQYVGQDKVRVEFDAFRYKIRGFYNNSNFTALEDSMAELRANPGVTFGNGASKLYYFYEALECDSDESEAMWKLHDRIHQAWEKAKPDSVTAVIAHADFLRAYGWHARGFDYADKVTPEGWRLLKERLEAAQQTLDKARTMTPQCPMWWIVQMRVALGLEWERPAFLKVYEEAKTIDPKFVYYDECLAGYLMPRWYGKEGEWEQAAAAELKRPNGGGQEGYARLVSRMRDYYGNVIQESNVSWPDIRAGFESLQKKYPDALGNWTSYATLACMANDREAAHTAFQAMGDYFDPHAWESKAAYNKYRDWAMSGSK